MAKTSTKRPAKPAPDSAPQDGPVAVADAAAEDAPAGGRKLVIVESPAKAKTIGKYLGREYVVKASMGHVRDLPKSGVGINVTGGFEPDYELLGDRRKVITELRKTAKTASEVYLATDPDREGEAIAWHLRESLGVPASRCRRVHFNEITRTAIRQAFASPHDLDMDMVNSQQARRILDRLVGYEISPLLWRKVAAGLSAGRVQSVAVRLIVEREIEIRAFVPAESWSIQANFVTDAVDVDQLDKTYDGFVARSAEGPSEKEQLAFLNQRGAFHAELIEVGGAKFEPTRAEDARRVVEALGFEVREVVVEDWPEYARHGLKKTRLVGEVRRESAGGYTIKDVAAKPSRSRPQPPFTTAALQQAAVNRLGFTASRTMRVAQQLYEGVDLGDGPVGLITYMRTDSVNLAPDAIRAVRDFIGQEFGARYLPESPNYYATKDTAQAAHEAIRPTDPTLTPQRVRDRLSDEQFRLYDLIWRRFVACQMPAAEWLVTTLLVARTAPVGECVFRAVGRVLQFDGFMKVAGVTQSDSDQELPDVQVGHTATAFKLHAEQHWTSPPPRYTEASLVKELESDNIGRPSTYASIIETIQRRKYVELRDKRFYPTHIGEVVTAKLVETFPQIMDVAFTAQMEDTLDKIADQHLDWRKVLTDFYGPFHQTVEAAMETMTHAKAEQEPAPFTCPKCGRPTVYRLGRKGRFLSCTGYDEITGYQDPPPTATGKKSRKKPTPIRACDYASPIDANGQPVQDEVTDVKCPKCGSAMVKRSGRWGPYLACSGYPACKNLVGLDKQGQPKWPKPTTPTGVTCHKCGKGEFVIRESKRGPFASCNRFPRCRNIIKMEKVPLLQEMTKAGTWPPANFDAGEEILGRSKKSAAAK